MLKTDTPPKITLENEICRSLLESYKFKNY